MKNAIKILFAILLFSAYVIMMLIVFDAAPSTIAIIPTIIFVIWANLSATPEERKKYKPKKVRYTIWPLNLWN
jgi:hypothetical protein